MTGSKIFIDTAPFIYALEDNEKYSQKVRNLFSKYYALEKLLCTSLLTFAEYCVVPYRENNIQKITDFETFISDAEIQISPFTKEVAKYASYVRAKYSGIKAMDALQLSSAIQFGCDEFLTNDKQLCQIKEINILFIDEID